MFNAGADTVGDRDESPYPKESSLSAFVCDKCKTS